VSLGGRVAEPELVSAAFVLPAGAFGERMRRVLGLIDGVHRVGPLPRIPIVERARKFGLDGRYRFHPHRGTPRAIEISQMATVQELTLIHEIGHFLDHQALGRPGSFASRRQLDLDVWRRAIEASQAVGRLRVIRRERELLAEDVTQVSYLLDYTELWARSFTQYVLTKGGDATLRRQLDEVTASRPSPFHLAQWSEDDHVSIVSAIDRLVIAKGWLR
jgi:hypothetical protein